MNQPPVFWFNSVEKGYHTNISDATILSIVSRNSKITDISEEILSTIFPLGIYSRHGKRKSIQPFEEGDSGPDTEARQF